MGSDKLSFRALVVDLKADRSAGAQLPSLKASQWYPWVYNSPDVQQGAVGVQVRRKLVLHAGRP